MPYILPEELAQALINYLAQRPYGEVVNLIQALQGMEKLPEKPELKPEQEDE